MENPSTHSDLELFTRQLNFDTRTTIGRVFTPTFFGLMGFSTAVIHNILRKRPILSGIQRHIIFTSIGVPLGMYVDQWNEKRYAKRDAALIYYMQTHPEDFPVTERVKYKDILDSWLPRR